MKVERLFTASGEEITDTIEFELRTSEIRNPDGSLVFQAKSIAVPRNWSQVATDILAQKYFRRAGVPVATVYCAAGDLNGSKGDHFDTHADNFNKLKNILLPPFDQAASTLVEDLKERGKLDETLVVMLTDFGRTPKINGGAGRDLHAGACWAGGSR